MTSPTRNQRADVDVTMAGSSNDNDDLVASLPDEILDYVLSLVSAYGDLRGCALVCKRWYKAVARVAAKTRYGFKAHFLNDFVRYIFQAFKFGQFVSTSKF